MIRALLQIAKTKGIRPMIDRVVWRASGGNLGLVGESYYASRVRNQSPISSFGVKIRTDQDVFDSTVLKRFYWDNYEKHEKEALKSYLDGYDSLIDLGASTGFLSSYAMQISDGLTVISVEGNPELIPILEDTRDLNDTHFKSLS